MSEGEAKMTERPDLGMKDFAHKLGAIVRKSGFQSGLTAALKQFEPEIDGASFHTCMVLLRIVERISALTPPEEP